MLLWLTDGSAAATKPSWGAGGIYWVTDQYDPRQIWELRTAAELQIELFQKPSRCPPAVQAR